jgi:hypothetical protein
MPACCQSGRLATSVAMTLETAFRAFLSKLKPGAPLLERRVRLNAGQRLPIVSQSGACGLGRSLWVWQQLSHAAKTAMMHSESREACDTNLVERLATPCASEEGVSTRNCVDPK